VVVARKDWSACSVVKEGSAVVKEDGARATIEKDDGAKSATEVETPEDGL
jgi:hypothetical protein